MPEIRNKSAMIICPSTEEVCIHLEILSKLCHFHVLIDTFQLFTEEPVTGCLLGFISVSGLWFLSIKLQ